MNDRFKFRVWDKYTHETPAEEMQFLCFNGCVVDSDGCHHSPDDYIIEQCTGLKDKNGNLIYEGDLLTDGRDIGQVLWTGAGWGCTAFLFKKKPETLKICGNIHEQAEQKD